MKPIQMGNIEFVIPENVGSLRADKAIALETHLSRSTIAKMFDDNRVLINGKAAKRSEKVSANDVIICEITADDLDEIQPEQIHLNVVYEDDYLTVINKEAGMVVHPGAGNKSGTIANALLHMYPQIRDVGQAHRPGIVHRLDSGTSGLLVVAKTQEAYEGFVEKFSTHDVDRQYIALVLGQLDSNSGVIDAPIGRNSFRITQMAVKDDGKFARTHYKVREYLIDQDLSLLDISLETGRTHQIRVHLSAIGHPIVGDKKYGGFRQNIDCPRPFLHAHTLTFEHPITKENMAFTAPLPPDLENVLQTIRDQE